MAITKADSENKPVRVFISYSHDSPSHKNRVLSLAVALRNHGIDVELDQFHEAEIVDWPRWCNDQISRKCSDLVVCVCTVEYCRRIEGNVPPEKGRGVYWEGSLLDDDIYDEKGNRRIIPVLFDKEPEPSIPRFLRGWTHCRLQNLTLEDLGYELLIRILTKQARVEKTPLGTVPVLPSDEASRAAPTQSGALEVAPTRLHHGAADLVSREKELADLDKAWDDPATHVVTIVAWGGVGKTALVVEWMARMAKDGWRGAERVFDWSFYSQGTSDTTTASSDPFIAKALEFFGDPEMAHSAASPWDKGERLAHLVAEHRTLLTLDGVEPLQYPPGPKGGQLKDQALEALLKRLVQDNRGLCIVTTREPLIDLDAWMDKTLVYLGESEQPEDKHPRLCRLSTEAGAQLLFRAGVRKAGNAQIKADDKELEDAAREIDGHALTLQLLGKYLARGHNGDVRKRSLVSFEKADAKVQGGHAFRMMAAYEKWLVPRRSLWQRIQDVFLKEKRVVLRNGRRQLAVLHLVGLFDRPADAGCIVALRQEPAIEGLTETLIGLDEGDWNYTLSNLRECGLITERADESAIDAHPLVREYFGKQLREKKPKAWQAAHRRLYEYLQKMAPDHPDDYQAAIPLCHAFIHGCLAGEHERCFSEIYRRRIERGRHHYLTNALGATGTEIHLLGFLFREPWTRTVDTIQGEHALYAFRQVGLALRALGRMREAVPCLVTAAKLSREIGHRNSEINSCRHLAQTLAANGRLDEALDWARQAVDQILAWESQPDKIAAKCTSNQVRRFDTVAAFASLADVLHQQGNSDNAAECFREAEKRLETNTNKKKYLSSLQGYRYCELLLERRKYQEVRLRSAALVHREDHARFRAARGLGLLMRAKALHLARVNHVDLGMQFDQTQPKLVLEEGLKHLWSAGQQEFYVFGLLCRADLRAEQNLRGAQADLDEAWQIAQRGQMKLHMADVHLHRARLFRDKAALTEARKLIEECGYWRRKQELEDVEEAAKSW